MIGNSGSSKAPASPYAAPNTPIASAKRARTSARKDIRSPMQARKLLVEDNQESPNMLNDGAERTRKTSLSTTPTLSKALFSPALRYDEHELSHHATTEKSMDSSNHSQSEDSASSHPSHGVEVVEESEETEEEEFNPYFFISSLPPYSDVSSPGRLCLPNSITPQRMTLVLDLDETLVHCTVDPISRPDLVFPVAFNGTSYKVFVRKRPYLDYFLETVSKTFEVVVFTASQKVYAERLLDLLDPQKNLVQHRLFRDSCLCVQGNFIKDLGILNRDLTKTILVDNSPHAYGYQVNNGVPIESWYDDDTDTELLKLINFLRKLQQSSGDSGIGSSEGVRGSGGGSGGGGTSTPPTSSPKDVRDIIKEHFKSYLLVERAASGQAVPSSAPPF
eukprot:gene11752-24648_t